MLTIDTILNRSFVLFDPHGPGTNEVFCEEVLELLQFEYGVRTPHRWIVNLVSKSRFEGSDYGCRDAFGADSVTMDELHQLDIFVFRLETDTTVELYIDWHVYFERLLICGSWLVVVWLLL